MTQKDYKKYAQDVLGVEFKNIELLITALTHRSYLNEHRKSATEHNERLEFLGDAVLELAVTRYLYSNYNDPEGVLTNLRSSLVRTESIAEVADRLGVSEFLRLSRGEKQGGERAKEQILANSFEAIVGSIYLDQGFEPAEKFIVINLIPRLKTVLQTGSWVDAKSQLQEELQRDLGLTPVYKVLDEQGPDHDKQFTVGVFGNKKKLGEGRGPSKQLAQQEAAKQALTQLQR